MKEKAEQIQLTMFGTNKFPTYEEIIAEYSKEFENYVTPKGNTIFGFWMQTLADLELLDLELKGLTNEYKIDPINRVVELKGDVEFIRKRIAHLEMVKGKKTLYWQTTYGKVEIEEPIFTKENKQYRPFSSTAEVKCRGYSMPLERVLTDFGADDSFGKAQKKAYGRKKR